MDVQYNQASKQITFDVAGTSEKEQNVTATMTFTAYGKQIYQRDFDPCDPVIKQLCPVPAGNFAAQGSQDIPPEFASQIPSIAFNIPDLDGVGKVELKSKDGGEELACVQSSLGNGKSMQNVAVPLVAAGIAGAALLLSALTSALAGGQPGSATPSPTFIEVMGWFQSMAMNGMLSVSYPQVYQSFSTNFGFSTGLIPWGAMQTSIDNFRKATGGNLTENNYEFLRDNVTLVQTDGQNNNVTKRSLDFLEKTILFARDNLNANVNGTNVSSGDDANNGTSDANNKEVQIVHGIQGYVEELTIPQANTFMTVLLIFAIVIASITVGILLFKVILETWALFGSFPKKLTSFRKRYWWLLAKTITNLILLLYGTWTLYCIYQFSNGDSWAAKVLAGVTLAAFTAILAFFTWKIWSIARRFKQAEGDSSALFEDKETWRKYSLFYENYKRSYWWLFVPSIVYMFARGCVIAGGNGHGLAQSAGQLIIESLMLILLLWSRPYSLKSGNWINIFIQVVRVLSVVCILVFVDQLGLSQTTKTITGVVLIVVQCVLTGLLGILIAVNAIVLCVKENPHRRKRKAAEKLNRDLDALTPLDARNSLLMDPTEAKNLVSPATGKSPLVSPHPMAPNSGFKKGGYGPVAQEQHGLMSDAAGMGADNRDRSTSPAPWDDDVHREPRLPDLDQDTSYRRRW
ncbi:MAG: hypothetical protein M1820_007679 [Bogoriella megaspora]|nr:MAG: hypothetical protein M1820_007679 [Bogoriella megaspora]